MSEKRGEALNLLGELKVTCEGYEFEVSLRAFAMQAVIFERLNPALWDDAIADARIGLNLALPETEQ